MKKVIRIDFNGMAEELESFGFIDESKDKKELAETIMKKSGIQIGAEYHSEDDIADELHSTMYSEFADVIYNMHTLYKKINLKSKIYEI